MDEKEDKMFCEFLGMTEEDFKNVEEGGYLHNEEIAKNMNRRICLVEKIIESYK